MTVKLVWFGKNYWNSGWIQNLRGKNLNSWFSEDHFQLNFQKNSYFLAIFKEISMIFHLKRHETPLELLVKAPPNGIRWKVLKTKRTFNKNKTANISINIKNLPPNSHIRLERFYCRNIISKIYKVMNFYYHIYFIALYTYEKQ